MFCLWLKNLGLTGEYMLRIFGLKDGLEFYVLDRENPGEYSDFCSNGPPGVSALLIVHMTSQRLTLYIQL